MVLVITTQKWEEMQKKVVTSLYEHIHMIHSGILKTVLVKKIFLCVLLTKVYKKSMFIRLQKNYIIYNCTSCFHYLLYISIWKLEIK